MKRLFFLFFALCSTLQCRSQSANDYFTEGFSIARNGHYAEAIKKFDKAISMDSTDEIWYFNRAEAKKELKDFTGAMMDYNRAIKMNPKYGLAYMGRGFLKQDDLQDYRGAIVDYDNAIQLDSLNAEQIYFRAMAKFFLKNDLGAISDFNKVVALNPNYAKAYYYMGKAKLSLGYKELGCLDLSKAGELGESQAYDVIKSYCR